MTGRPPLPLVGAAGDAKVVVHRMAAIAGEAVEVGADFLQKAKKLNIHTCSYVNTSLKMIQTPRLSVGCVRLLWSTTRTTPLLCSTT